MLGVCAGARVEMVIWGRGKEVVCDGEGEGEGWVCNVVGMKIDVEGLS